MRGSALLASGILSATGLALVSFSAVFAYALSETEGIWAHAMFLAVLLPASALPAVPGLFAVRLGRLRGPGPSAWPSVAIGVVLTLCTVGVSLVAASALALCTAVLVAYQMGGRSAAGPA